MRGMTVLFMLLALTLCLPAAPTAGYGWSVGGTAPLVSADAAYSSIGLGLVMQPFGWKHFDPAVRADLSIATVGSVLVLHDLSAGVELTVLRTLQHPFGFLMPTNLTAYAPAVSLDLQWRLRHPEAVYLSVGLSLLRLSEKDAIYTWVSPFVTFNLDAKTMDSWGVTLWRFSYLVW
jgi:hypothetical protein